MRFLKIPAVAVAVVLALVALRPATTRADSTSSLTFPVSVTCVSAGQLCSPAFSVVVPTSGLLEAEFIASPGHCSSIRVYFFVDSNLRFTSGFLAAGQTTGFVNLSLGFVTPGNHQIDVQAEGQVGGCNSGSLGSWAGTLNVHVSTEVREIFGPRFVFNNSGVAAAVVAAAGQTAAKNRARAAQAAAAAAQPVVTAPSTGTGIVTSLPSTGDGGALVSSRAMTAEIVATGLALIALGGAVLLGARRATRRR